MAWVSRARSRRSGVVFSLLGWLVCVFCSTKKAPQVRGVFCLFVLFVVF